MVSDQSLSLIHNKVFEQIKDQLRVQCMTSEENQKPETAEQIEDVGSGGWLETERIIMEMLRITSSRLPLKETLGKCLDVLLRTTWLRVQNKGGIFLVEGEQETLKLVVEHNLGKKITSLCAEVKFGHCLCGRAAILKTIQHADCVDDRHDIKFEGMQPHGHYNVPILSDGKVLGVMVFYLPHGFKKKPSELAFLESAANILSLMIQLKSHESSLENMVAERTQQLEKEMENGKQKALALHKSESRLTELLELVPEAIVSVDGEGRICLFNQSAESLFGYSKQEMIGGPLEQLMPERFRDNHRANIHNFGKSETAIKVMSTRREILGQKKDGTEFPAHGSISKLNFDGSELYTVLIQDITEQRNTAQALENHNKELRQRDLVLQTQNQRFDAAISAMSHGLAMFDKDENLIISNDRYAEIYKLSPDQVSPGMNLRQILEIRVEHGKCFGANVDENIDEMRMLRNNRIAKLRKFVLCDGRHVEIRNQSMDNGGWLSIHEDVTERYNSEKKIKYLADYDTLTDLPNRTQIQVALEKAIRQSSDNGTEMALLYIDLDGFKEINDTLGHPVGDHVLNVIGSRLAEFQSDTIIAGRLSGDEFVMIVKEFNYRPYLERLADRICTTLAMPIDAQHDVIVLSASIGISIGPPEDGDEDTLTQYSDLALYQAKTDGGKCYRFFEEKMYVRAKERQRLAADLRNAIRKNELVVHYQPQVDLRTGKINGYEALVRWQHDELGMISPFQFIGLAEETGQISEIGEWVLRTACEYACKWPNKEKISVNLSPIQFKRQDVSTMVKRVLWGTGLEPGRLELEITESVLIQSTDSVIIVLRTLAEMGVSIALDDFGTGFSSLSYLTTFPFNKIKIDKSFIDNLGKDTEVTAIVAMIVGLGRNLDTVITAEGIEEFRQHELLRASGCDQGQGYLYGKPQPQILVENQLEIIKVA